MDIGDRIKDLRNALKLTQKDLAEKVGITYIQIGRYEKKKAAPSSDVLQRIADALNTTADYLMNGTSDEIATGQIQNKELLNLFKSVDKLSTEDKNMVYTFLDALITKRKIQQVIL